MKQQLPLLDPNFQISPESKKTVTLPEDINSINYPTQSKNLNYLRYKYYKKPTKFSVDLQEAKIYNNFNSNPNYNNLNNNIVINEINKSSATKLDLNGYRKVNSGEERLENLGMGLKIGSMSIVNNAIKESISKEQMALRISLEDIKRKNEDLKKRMELKESKAFYKFRPKLAKIVDSNAFVIFFMILTLFIMFISDIQNAWLPADSDNAIDYLQTIILFLFTIEIILTCLAKEGYSNSFFFWLDVVSTLSIIQDIGFIFDPLLSLGSDTTNNEMFSQLSNNSTDVGANKSLKSVNQALGKITAVSRITRILRIIRVIRLIRIVKLYKNAMLARENILKRRRERQKNAKKNSCIFMMLLKNKSWKKRLSTFFAENFIFIIKTKIELKLVLETNTANASNPINNFGLVMKNMDRRFSKSVTTPIKRDSANVNCSNNNIEIENKKENVNISNNDMVVSGRENNIGRITNDYVQINDVNVMEGNNIYVGSLPQNIEMEIKNEFNRDTTAPSFPKKNRPSRSSITLTHKQLKFITDERKKTPAAAAGSLIEKSQKESLSSKMNPTRQEISLENLIRESKTSKIVTEAITKKVIILILSILIMLPILDDSFYSNDDVLGYNILSKYISNYFTIFSNDSIPNYLPPALNNSIWSIILDEADDIFPIVNITSFQDILYINETWANYTFRKSELSTAVSTDENVVILFSLLYDNQIVALLNILKTICLCILVTIATIYFESDVKKLVLDPLEIMIEIVDKVAKDPIKAKNLENLETGMKTTISKLKNEEESHKKNDPKQIKRKAEEEYEVKIIQSAIMKISALLAIGIGEAGNEIIKQNLSSYNDLNPMVKGRKKKAIFGFCDIRGFPEVNEALQEHTMVFLNQIADLVHSSVDLFGGSTNKNIGDAFLMVWKLPNDLNVALPQADTKDSNSPLSQKQLESAKNTENLKNTEDKIQNNQEVNLRTHNNFLKINNNPNINENIKIKQNNESTGCPEVRRIADLSVFGFLKIIAKINRDLRILSYRQDEEIKKKINDYKVNMGFGLHMGWAIEGAIGSSYKIDASYLSPNVNMAARLEAATRQYGVSILISGPLFELLSESTKRLCRLIDIVTVKGSNKPVKFYTIDINENLKPSKKMNKSISDKNARFKLLQKKEQLRIRIDDSGVPGAMMKKKYFKQMLRNARPSVFNHVFKEGFDAYINGDWSNAGKKFEECLGYFENDGPTDTLLSFIKQHNFQAPSNWQGFRVLTSK